MTDDPSRQMFAFIIGLYRKVVCGVIYIRGLLPQLIMGMVLLDLLKQNEFCP